MRTHPEHFIDAPDCYGPGCSHRFDKHSCSTHPRDLISHATHFYSAGISIRDGATTALRHRCFVSRPEQIVTLKQPKLVIILHYSTEVGNG